MKLKTAVTILISFALITAPALPVSAESVPETGLPYDAYVYDNDLDPVLIPAPYAVSQTISGTDIGLDGSISLSDIFYDGADRLYLSDAGNNRLIITDKNFRLLHVVDSFMHDGVQETFSSPSSCYANADSIYIADSANSRIVVLQRDTLELNRILEQPQIPQLGEDFIYTPTRLTVDYAGRIYVIAKGVNKGLIRLAPNGSFTSFFGAPDVEYNILELLWRKIATKEQREQMQQYVPTEYSAVLMDKKGFLYTVSQTSATTSVAKLNSAGDNVLNDLALTGDAEYLQNTGQAGGSYFTDICLGPNDTYAILDAQSSKIYVYNSDGEILYAFGNTGSQKGLFYSASSVEQMEDSLLVTDGTKGTITIFRLTQFGRAVQGAIQAYEAGEYEAAYAQWQEIEGYCSNYIPAIMGMAKIDMALGNTGSAITTLHSIHARQLYSKAYEQARNDAIRCYFLPIGGILFLLAVCILIGRKYIRRTKVCQLFLASDFYNKQRFATYAMFHPFDGHWDIKHEKRGDLKNALFILAAFIVCYAIRVQYSGYAVTGTISENVNVPYQLLLILLPIVFWIVSNWCFTALMDGKGTMKDIVVATCYALKPYVMLSIPLFVLSHVLTAEEAMLYGALDVVCVVWTLALIFLGMMTIHDYSLGKSILTAVLTLLGMCIILFILLLLISLVQQIFMYFYGIYKELIFRTY